jgi:hypothetical protein
MSLDEQAGLVKEMNGYINARRDAYNSLFLANSARVQKKGYFALAFDICNYVLSGRVGGESAIMKEA